MCASRLTSRRPSRTAWTLRRAPAGHDGREGGWQVITTYTDPGHSGRSMNRPGVQQLRADALRKPRAFDVVIVHKLDRWSRSIKDTITTLDDLEHAGVSFAPPLGPSPAFGKVD